MQDFNGEIDFSKLKKADFNPAQRLDLNGEIDFSKLKVAKNQPSFAGGDGTNFAQNWANLKANSDPSAQNIGANSSANLEANSAKKHPQNAQILANKNQNAQYITPQNSANLNIYNLPKKASKSEQNINAQGGDEHSSYAGKFSQAIQEGFNYLADNHENITAFASGAGKIYHDYAGGINKAIAKGLDNLAGDYANADFPRIANALKTSRDFFAQNANLSAQSSQILKEQMARGNNYAGVAGEILFDPMLAMPAGIITKGGKGALNTLKSIGAGASLGAGTSAIRDYNDDAISAQQMRQNAIINSAIWGGANGLLASKLIEQGARNLGHKIAPNKIDDYATAMAKKGGNLGANEANLGSANLSANEANLGSANSRENLEASGANPNANPRANLNPSAQNPNLGAKNPRASQRELEGSIDFSQLEKSDFTPNFTQVSEAKQTFPYNAFLDIENSLAQELKLPNTQIKASLEYLRAHHPESFKSKREVYETIKSLLKNNDYVGDSLKNKNAAYIAKQNDELISDMAINRDSGGVFHLNKDRKMSNSEIERMASAVGTSNSQHKQLVPWAQMNTSKEHFSPINGEILPQNADNFAQNLDQSAQNLSNANLNAPNLSGDLPNANLNAPNLPNANFHNPRAEFSANNAYENFSNPNNPHAFMSGGGGENPRFMPYSTSQNPRANAREVQERTGFLNGEHLGAKEASLMNGSVDFTHLKKADFPPNSSANLAFGNSKDVLTWRAQSANVGENLKPNGANTARTNEVNQGANLGANEAQNGTTPHASETNSRMANLDANGANLGADKANLGSANSRENLGKRGETSTHENGANPHSSEINLDATPHARSANQKADKANEGVIPQELAQGSVNFSTLKKVDFTPSKTSTKNGEISADKNAFNKLENEKFEAIKNGQKRREEIKLKAQEADLRSANEANLRARQEAHAKAQQEAINEQEHLNANSLTNDTRANEANLRTQQETNLRAQQETNLSSANETNLSSADTTKAPKAKLTKEQNEAQKLLKQILKALKTSPTKKAFSISAGEKQTWENAINEKLKELKEKEQILKEQPSANFGEVPHTLAQPSLNLNALEKMKFSLSQEAALKAKIKAQKAKLEERANKNLEALIEKEQTAHTKTSQEVQQQALQDAGEAEEKLGALLDYAKSKENKARNFINSLLLRSTLGAGYGALANKDDRLKGAMIGAGAGAIGIPLLRTLPHNFKTTMAKNALSGAVIGATSDSDNRVRGAMIGALAGASGVPLALKVAGKLGAKANYNQNLREAMLDLHKNKGWRNIDDSFSGLIKRNFSDTLGGEYREIESQMNANINKQMYHLQDTFKSLSNLSENTRREAHLYLSGELDKSVNLEPNLKAQLDNLRKSLDDNQRTLYELGRLERPLEADEITNSWLHRIYDKNKDGNFVFAGEAKTIEDIKTRGKVWKMDEEDFIKQINSGKIDVNLFNKPLYEGGIRATKTAQGKIELRRDWTFEERTKMGEIRDVAQTLPLSLIHQVRLIEQAKFLKAVSTLKVDGVDILKGAKEIENLKATFGEEEFKEVLKKQGFSQIPDDKKFGALRGRFVRSDIKDDLVGKFDSFRSNWSETAKVASDTWLQINKLMKKSKTIYNPVTHVNNIASNIAFLKMQGVSNPEIISGLKEYYSLMKKAPLYQDLRIKALENKATSEDLARLNELKKEFGIYDSAQEVGLFGKSDLNDMSKETLFTKDNLIARSLNKTRIFGENSLISKSANKFDDWISDIYQGEDNVMRYVAFASHLKNGMSIKEAKLITNSLMPDYTKQIPFGIRVLRDSAISPFISWNYYVMPLLAKLSATPAGATHILGSFALLSGIGMSFNPTKSKDKPDRSFGAFVDIGKKGDTRTQLKVDRMLPQLQMVRPSSYASELLLQSPVLQAFSDAKSLLNGDTPTNLYFNKPITFKNKNMQDKALDYAKHFGQTYTPTPQAAWNLLEYMRALLQSENARRI